MHCLANRANELFVALVIFVLAVRDHARGCRYRHECFGDVDAIEGGFEIIDVALQLRLPRIGDWSDADRIKSGRNAFAGVELGIELREARAVGAALEDIGAGHERAALESAQPLEHILRPADRFSKLAIAYDINPGVGLAAHDLGNRLGEELIVFVLVESLALLLRPEDFLQFRRPNKTSDMGGEDAVGAAFHERWPSSPAMIVARNRPCARE